LIVTIAPIFTGLQAKKADIEAGVIEFIEKLGAVGIIKILLGVSAVGLR